MLRGPGFYAVAEEHPESAALIDPKGVKLDAGELLARCNRVAHGLRALGLRTGDSVAMLLPNGIELFELYLAVMQTGLYLVPINTGLVESEIAFILADAEAKAFVAHERFPAAVAAARSAGMPSSACFSVGALPGFRPFGELSAGQPSDLPDDRTSGMLMNYTSGTTGRPKGVRRPLLGIPPEATPHGFAGLWLLFRIKRRDGNVHLCTSPLYHGSNLIFAGGALHHGHEVVVMDAWSPEETLALVEKHRVTTLHMVPTQLQRLLALSDVVKKKYDVSSIRQALHTAAPCPPAVKRGMIAWWGPVIGEYYGATEGGGTAVFADEWLARPGTVGRPWPGSEIVILDDEGRVLPPGQIGTVYMRFANRTFEYFKDREKTEGNRRGHLFTVGDLGELDADGWLYLRDRKIDMIICGGSNVYAAEVEGVLALHPKIADVAVIGVPDDEWGEVVKAVIVAAGDVPSDALASEILAWCAGRLAKHKTPRSIQFVAELPRDPMGKVLKRKLRA